MEKSTMMTIYIVGQRCDYTCPKKKKGKDRDLIIGCRVGRALVTKTLCLYYPKKGKKFDFLQLNIS